MKYLFALLVICNTYLNGAIPNIRPLIIAARNRQLQRPPNIRRLTICRFVNDQWQEREYIKEPKENPLSLDLGKKIRVKRNKPWRSE